MGCTGIAARKEEETGLCADHTRIVTWNPQGTQSNKKGFRWCYYLEDQNWTTDIMGTRTVSLLAAGKCFLSSSLAELFTVKRTWIINFTCVFMPAFSYLTSACFHTAGFANPLLFGPVPYGFRGTSQKGKAKKLHVFPEQRAPDIFWHLYLPVTCMFQPLSLTLFAQNSSIISVFGIQRFVMFDVDHLDKVKPHPFLLIDVMMTNHFRTLSEGKNWSEKIAWYIKINTLNKIGIFFQDVCAWDLSACPCTAFDPLTIPKMHREILKCVWFCMYLQDLMSALSVS